MSHVGKQILLKVVIQAIPTNTMSVFQLPKSLSREITSMMGKLWWGHQENDHKIAWMGWNRLGKTKNKGKLVYRELDYFNLALIAKQGWKLLQQLETLATKVFREKYYPGGLCMESNLGRRPSYAWRSIWNAKQLLQKGLIWKVGNGAQIRIWGDKWINSTHTHTHMIQAPIQILDREAQVNEIINQEANWWNVPLIKSIFPTDVAEQICSMAISLRLLHESQTDIGWNNNRQFLYLECIPLKGRTKGMGPRQLFDESKLLLGLENYLDVL